MNRKRRYLYLIKRCPRPHHHRAPYHPVIICDLKRVAMWEAGETNNRAWVWSTDNEDPHFMGWLLERWEGLDIDYGSLVKAEALPDGTPSAFYHYSNSEPYIEEWKKLFRGAVWWSDREMPNFLKERGVIYPPDRFTRQDILDTIADDGVAGFAHARQYPEFWSPAIPDEEAGYL